MCTLLLNYINYLPTTIKPPIITNILAEDNIIFDKTMKMYY